MRHTIAELLSHLGIGLAIGYEGVFDHDERRHDPLLGMLVGSSDPTQRPFAGKSTLNRLELVPADATADTRSL